MGNSTLVYVYATFTPSQSCSLTYSLTTCTDTAYESFITFNQTAIIVTTNDNSKVNTYCLKITATITGFTANNYAPFNLVV